MSLPNFSDEKELNTSNSDLCKFDIDNTMYNGDKVERFLEGLKNIEPKSKLDRDLLLGIIERDPSRSENTKHCRDEDGFD